MNIIKRAISSLLILSLAFGSAGCGSAHFSHRKMKDFAEAYDMNVQNSLFESLKLEKSIWSYHYRPDYDSYQKYYYYSTEGDAARFFYDSLVNPTGELPQKNVTKVTSIHGFDKESHSYGSMILITFEKSADAADCFEEIAKSYWLTDDNYIDNGHYRCVYEDSQTTSFPESFWRAVYYSGHEILMVRMSYSDSTLIRDFCKSYGIKGPEE